MNAGMRNSKSIVAGVVTLVGACMVAAALPADAVQSYIAAPLGSLGGVHSYGRGINYRGQITGMAQTARPGNPSHAFLYTDGHMVDLGAYGSDCCSDGAGINNLGHVTGISDPSPEGMAPRAILYADGNMTDLGTLGCNPSFMFPSGGCARGAGINDRGQVTGSSGTTDGSGHAFLWSDGRMIDLGTLGGRGSWGISINGSGQVAGWSYLAGDGPEHAFLYADGRMIDLGTLGGTFSVGYAINDNGQGTGASATAVPHASHAFLYTEGRMIDLGTLGGDSSTGYGINNHGQVTGHSSTSTNATRAFLYADGRMYDLNTLVTTGLDGATLEVGTGINDRGQIVANGCTATVCQAYRLDPIAPPSQANYQGLWWHAFPGSESGWGINFAHQGDAIFATWFTYDTAGKGWWLSTTAWKTAEGVFSGTIIATTGPVFSALPFDPTRVTRTPVGTGTIAFHWDGKNANFDYTVNGVHQTKALIRQVFGPLPTCTFQTTPDFAVATNFQDLWWVADGAESGWGINLTHQGDAIFATWFTYDADGAPLWLSMTANRSGPRVYSGQLIRTTGPAFNAMPWDREQVTRTVVGTVAFTFANGNAATFAYTLNGVSQTKSITRQLFFPPGGNVCSDAVPTPATVTVSRPQLSPGVGDRVQLTAVARDATGAVMPGMMTAATWSSSDPGVAIVDPGGVLQARAAGKVTVRATIGGISGEQTLTVMPAMRVGVTVGAKEVVFRYATDRCNEMDFPDGPPVAVRAEDGSLVLFAGLFADRGGSFETLTRDCSRRLFESPHLLAPESYENGETLWSIYREGSRWHALLINEFHDPVASTCSPGNSGASNPCTYMSLTYAMSTDGARTFVKPNPPAHVVVPAPYVWVPPSADTPTSSSQFFEGYAAGARILRGNDGYYYFTELFLTPSKSDPVNSGPRAMRTDRLDDPASWRAWDGSGFNLPLTSPYITGRPGPLPAWLYGPLPSYYNTYLERYLQLSVSHGNVTIDGRRVCGVLLSLAPDLLSWAPPLNLIVETSDPACESGTQPTRLLESVPIMYLSLIDHADPTVNFERPGRTAYLYYVRFNRGTQTDPLYWLDRDVVRVPLTFTRQD